MLLELRELSNKQKEQIKELQKDISTYSCEVENVSHSSVIFQLILKYKERRISHHFSRKILKFPASTLLDFLNR